MKTKLSILFLLFSMGNVMADDAKYTETMTKNIALVYKAETTDDLIQAVNMFNRVGTTEKNKWEPFYYEAFGYIMLANREQDAVKKDAFLDQAKIAMGRAGEIKANESEIVALEGFISMIRVSVDPLTRGQQYSGLAMQSFDKAVALNPENPRALALLARMQFGMAQFFNSSTTEACSNARKALEKFTTFKPESTVAPVWGKGVAESILKDCK